MAAPSSDAAAIKQVLRALRIAGCVRDRVFDGEEWTDLREGVMDGDGTEDQALEAITAVDDAFLYVTLYDGSEGWVRFVLGNDPEEVVCNHTTNLSSVLEPLTKSWW